MFALLTLKFCYKYNANTLMWDSGYTMGTQLHPPVKGRHNCYQWKGSDLKLFYLRILKGSKP